MRDTSGAAWQRQRHVAGAGARAQDRDAAGKDIAHAGAQAEGCGAGRQLPGRQPVQHLVTGPDDLVGGAQHFLAGWRKPRAAAADAAHEPLDERGAGQVAERVQRLPGGLVADAGVTRGLRDGAQRVHPAQDLDALVAGGVPEGVGQLHGLAGHAPILGAIPFVNSEVAMLIRWTMGMLFATLGMVSASAGQVQVAVAANMGAPMQRIAADFARATGHEALVALGSTGKFYAQIRSGAPFEVLLAADDETPARLEREDLAVAGTRFTYATGRLVLWSADAVAVDPQGNVLRQPARGRLAIADPRLAPYGAAAVEVLTRLGMLAAWQPNVVQGESIGQAYQFAASGAATLGFVALAQVMTDGRIAKGSAWVVPANLHAPLKQDAVILKPGQSNPAAAALVQYLKGDAARAILRGYGYEF
jgi:molybdate transport system substrate-binding protein